MVSVGSVAMGAMIVRSVVRSMGTGATEGSVAVTTRTTVVTSAATVATPASHELLGTFLNLGLDLVGLTLTHELLDEVLERVLGLILLFCLLIQDGNHESGGVAWHPDLEEGVRVAESLLTGGAVVEVFADGALVANTRNVLTVAAITHDSSVDSFAVTAGKFLNVDVLSGGLLLEDLFEDLSLLFGEFIPDEFLQGRALHAAVFGFFAAFFLLRFLLRQ